MQVNSLSVVQLHSFDYSGGAETVARLNHRGLNALGHKSQLLVAKKSGTDEDIEQIHPGRGFPGWVRLARKIEVATGLQYTYSPTFQQVSRQFRNNPDVVHLHSLHGAEGWADLTGVARLCRRLPTVLTLHDLWLVSGHCSHPMECDRWMAGCGSCPDLSRYPSVPKDGTHWNWKRKKRLFNSKQPFCIVPSEWVKSQVAKSPILVECPIMVVPNPIDSEVFRPGDRNLARSRLGIPLSASTVLMAANDLDNRYKGGPDGIAALNGLTGTGAFALLVGHNSEKFAQQINLPSKAIGFVDSREKMADCYLASDVTLVPSRVETFGLVAAEATACGSVVVSYKAGGLEEVTKNCHGILVEGNQIEGLREATRHLLESREERAARISLGQKSVFRHYSIEGHAAGCAQVYREAISVFSKSRSERFKN